MCFYLWILQISSLPKLYHRLHSKGGPKVADFRKLENLGHQLTRRILDVEFWNRCLDLRVCPQFLKFKSPKLNLYDNTEHLYQSNMLMVENSLKVAEKDHHRAKKLFYEKRCIVMSGLSFMEKRVLLHLLNGCFQKTAKEKRSNHNQKLLRTWLKDRPRSPDCIKNLSSRILSVEEHNVLYRGLKHHVLPNRVLPDTIKVSLEKVINEAVYNEAVSMQTNKSSWRSKSMAEKETIRDNIISVAQDKITLSFCDNVRKSFSSFMSACKKVCSARGNRVFHEALSGLFKDELIKVCSFDKGTGVCVLNSCDYYSKLDVIINDASKFERVATSRSNAKHPVLKRQESVRDAIKTLLEKHISDIEYMNLIPKGSGPGKLYGMCKIHKKDYPMRPVVSMIGTAEYQLAKFLDALIKPNLPKSFMLSSTDEFLEKLNKFKIQPGDKCLSFDVSSLFTNVPLTETIEMIADHIYSEKASLTPSFDKEAFIKLLKIATGGVFMYRDVLFQQVDGVSMGNPLAPTLANFFLAHIEENLFQKVESFYPSFFVRYVDDIFCVFRAGVDWSSFFRLLNSVHPNLKFTCEEPNGSRMPFLDVNIELGEGGCDTWVFRKETNTDVLLNYEAVAPTKWKSGLILCLLNRAYRICSSSRLFGLEVEKLKNIFIKNAYPASFFDKVHKKFMEKLTTNSQCTDAEEENFRFNLSIPYIGKQSIKFGNKITALLKATFDIDVQVVYTTTKVRSFFQLKSRTPLPLLSCVVYEFACLGDQTTTYVGMTERNMTTRVGDHLRKSSKTAVGNHRRTCQTCQTKLSIDSFKILKKCRNEKETKIFEALEILKRNPKLNRQMHKNKGASFILNVFN